MAVSPRIHNLVHVSLAALGIAMLVLAYVDWVDHPLTLWIGLP